MAKRRRDEKSYNYTCSITGTEVTLKHKAANPDDLVTVAGYYELNPEKDDRPDHIKKQLGIDYLNKEK